MASLISFKNVGLKKYETETDLLSKSITPIGILTPVRSAPDSLFKMSYDIKDQIQDNLRNLILTNWGERLGRYNFGANLRPLLTEFHNIDSFDQEAMVRINTAVSIYMPFVSLGGFSSEFDLDNNRPLDKVRLTIVYDLPDLNIRDKKLEVTLTVL